jgi:protein gp37
MAQSSSIEWTDATWNPVTGCTKISPGCKHCYAYRMAKRLQAMGQERYRNGFDIALQPDLLKQPFHWKAPRRIFVNSMSDVFHEAVPESYISRIFATMADADWHSYQVLTKRTDRLRKLADRLPWPRNVWMGVSVESEAYLPRVRDLQAVPSAVRFLSVEPLLGRIRRIPLRGIDWVIVGGESGPGARLMQPEWAREIRDQCMTADVPFFFKQWGGTRKARTGRVLDGRYWDEMPVARVRRASPARVAV